MIVGYGAYVILGGIPEYQYELEGLYQQILESQYQFLTHNKALLLLKLAVSCGLFQIMFDDLRKVYRVKTYSANLLKAGLLNLLKAGLLSERLFNIANGLVYLANSSR